MAEMFADQIMERNSLTLDDLHDLHVEMLQVPSTIINAAAYFQHSSPGKLRWSS